MAKLFKLLFFTIVAIMIIGSLAKSCGGSDSDSEKTASTEVIKKEPGKGTCNCEVNIVADNTRNFYFNVSNFDAENKDCYSYLKQWVEANTGVAPGVTAHFFDNIKSFTPPESGMYGDEKVRKKVILQVVSIGDSRKFSFDPFGTGKYTEK
jgi:hypothetical protein